MHHPPVYTVNCSEPKGLQTGVHLTSQRYPPWCNVWVPQGDTSPQFPFRQRTVQQSTQLLPWPSPWWKTWFCVFDYVSPLFPLFELPDQLMCVWLGLHRGGKLLAIPISPAAQLSDPAQGRCCLFPYFKMFC